MRSVQSKGETTADSKTNQQSLTSAETKVVCFVTKTFGEKTVLQKSLSVDVEEMVSATESSECEERQRLKAEEVMTSRDNAKLLNDDNNLEFGSFTGKVAKQHCDEKPRQWNCHTFTTKKFHDPNAKKWKWTACHKARV